MARSDYVVGASGDSDHEAIEAVIAKTPFDRDQWTFDGDARHVEAKLDFVSMDADGLVESLKAVTSEHPRARMFLRVRGYEPDETAVTYVAAGNSYRPDGINQEMRNEDEIFEALARGINPQELTATTLLVITGPTVDDFPERVIKASSVLALGHVLEATKDVCVVEFRQRPILDGHLRDVVQQLGRHFPDNSFTTLTARLEIEGAMPALAAESLTRVAMAKHLVGASVGDRERGPEMSGR